jgi:outer membrane protein OmpA-like peptidoglycan-associated protein
MHMMKVRQLTLPTVLAGLLLAGCGSNPSKTSGAGDDVVFPDPARATVPEGSFVNIENLRKVAPGVSKRQLYAMLGTPHFNEGVFGVREWNYLFDFRKVDGESFSCQYQVHFDKDGKASAFYWKPASCKSVIDRPVEPVAAQPPVALPAQPIRLSSDALFAFDSAMLTEQGREHLSGLLKQVQSASQIEDILVVGYTDRIGTDSYNRTLSRRRAESVRDYLVSGGVSAEAIQVEGRGEADPVVQCTDHEHARLIACLAPNRRVELSGSARS